MALTLVQPDVRDDLCGDELVAAFLRGEQCPSYSSLSDIPAILNRSRNERTLANLDLSAGDPETHKTICGKLLASYLRDDLDPQSRAIAEAIFSRYLKQLEQRAYSDTLYHTPGLNAAVMQTAIFAANAALKRGETENLLLETLDELRLIDLFVLRDVSPQNKAEYREYIRTGLALADLALQRRNSENYYHIANDGISTKEVAEALIADILRHISEKSFPIMPAQVEDDLDTMPSAERATTGMGQYEAQAAMYGNAETLLGDLSLCSEAMIELVFRTLIKTDPWLVNDMLYWLDIDTTDRDYGSLGSSTSYRKFNNVMNSGFVRQLFLDRRPVQNAILGVRDNVNLDVQTLLPDLDALLDSLAQ